MTSLPNHFVANVPNYDNGNLMYLLLELIHPSLYFSCISAVYQMTSADLSSLSNVYHQTIVECFKLLLPSIQTRVSTIAPYIHIFLPHQGFWSTHARQDRFGKWWNDLFGYCYRSSTIIGHGWKGMAREFWGGAGSGEHDRGIFRELYAYASDELSSGSIVIPLPTEENDIKPNNFSIRQKCNVPGIRSGEGMNGKCIWLTDQEELDVASRYCLWASPICLTFKQNNRSITEIEKFSHNLCLTSSNSGCSRGKHTGISSIDVWNTTYLRALFLGSKFGVDKEDWWKTQICSSCPSSLAIL